MKKIPDSRTGIPAGTDRKQRRQSLAVTGAVALCFVLSSFTFMNFMYCLSDSVGSFVSGSADVALRGVLRSLPIWLSFFLSLCGLMTAHAFYRNESPAILRRKARKHAAAMIAIGVILIVYVIAMRIAGRYLSLTEGAPSALYPLDAVLYALLYIAAGTGVLAFFRKGIPFAGPARIPLRKKRRGIRSAFGAVWLLIALHGFCGFFFGLFILDFRHGYVLYSLAVMLVSLLAFLSLAAWEFFYNNLTEEKRKERMLPLALAALAVSVAASVLYFIALKKNLDGPSNVGFGLLPVAFSANVNFATLLAAAVPLIVSAVGVVKGLSRRVRLNR